MRKEESQRLYIKAVRSGKLVRPERCSICGGVNRKRRISGHHRDYRKPYDVNWVCQKCHTKKGKEKGQKTGVFKKGQDVRRNKSKKVFQKGFDSRRNLVKGYHGRFVCKPATEGLLEGIEI